MAQAAAAEVHADPNEAVIIPHQVDVVISAADRAELRTGLLPIGFHVGRLPGFGIVEKLMPDTLVIGPSDAERNGPSHVPDDGADFVGDRREGRIDPHRHVATADVEADAGNADLLLVRHNAADWLGLAEAAIRADHAGDGVAYGHAIAHPR